MQVRQYLRLMGQLYFEGAISDFHPDLLSRFGGSLRMAGMDAEHARVDPASILHMERRIADRWTAARIGWQRHVDQIRSRLAGGTPPSAAIYQYCANCRTTPHSPAQLQLMLRREMMANGHQVSHWQVATLRFRERFDRGSAVMRDTFGAFATMTALAMTADDWTHATPEEWDRALSVGEIGVIIGTMAGAHADARTARHETHATASARTH